MYVNPFKPAGDAEPVPSEPVQLFGVPYNPDVYPELAFKFCLLGATNPELAELLGVSPSCIDVWLVDYPLFRKSVQAGRDIADAEVAHSLYRCATGFTREEVKIFQFQGMPVVVPYTAYYAPDVSAQKHWLGVRQRVKWRAPTDTVDVAAKTISEVKQISADATPEQAADLYKRMLG
jgi:hypothetical protein